jgi:azurin
MKSWRFLIPAVALIGAMVLPAATAYTESAAPSAPVARRHSKMQNPFLRLVLVLVLGLTAVAGGTLTNATPTQAAAALSLSRGNAAPGDKVTATGSGFHAGDNLVVTTDVIVNGASQHVQVATTTDGSGSFSVAFTVPAGTAQGTYSVTAKDFHAGTASHALKVLPLAYITAGGTPRTVFVIPTHEFYISGQGFQPGEVINIGATFPLYDGNSAVVRRTPKANANGNFYESVIKVPADSKAITVTLTATGNTSKKSGKAFLHVTYRPTLSVAAAAVRPGTSLGVSGREFVPNSNVRVAVTISRTGTTVQDTLSKTVTSDSNGSFSTSIGIPSDTKLGRYTVAAIDSTGGFRASATFDVSVHPTILLKPNTLYPGQSFDVSGVNFASGVSVRVSATFPVTGGKTQTVAKTVSTSGRGGYFVTLVVPGNATPAKVIVTAASSNARITAPLFVRQAPVPATATPAPAATPTPTSLPAHHAALGFRYISIWYHVVRVGTYEVVVARATLHTKLGIWVHVYFPGGQGYTWYTQTSWGGKWSKKFSVPGNARTASNSQVLITFRLWHGSKSVKEFRKFSLVY